MYWAACFIPDYSTFGIFILFFWGGGGGADDGSVYVNDVAHTTHDFM